MGLGGTRHRTLGLPAMRWAVVVALMALTGCSSAGGILGAVTGTAAAVGSGNPAVGAAVGVGTRAVADYAISYASRRWHRTEQDALAAAVGTMMTWWSGFFAVEVGCWGRTMTCSSKRVSLDFATCTWDPINGDSRRMASYQCARLAP